MDESQTVALHDHIERIMTKASDSYELECRVTCRALKVSIAINGFGLGILLPNNLADDILTPEGSARARDSSISVLSGHRPIALKISKRTIPQDRTEI